MGVYYAKRNSTPFYLRRPIVDLGEREDEFEGLVGFLSSSAPAAALTHRKFVSALRERLPQVRAVAESGDYVVVSNRALPEGRLL